jgi:hypothetical protein
MTLPAVEIKLWAQISSVRASFEKMNCSFVSVALLKNDGMVVEAFSHAGAECNDHLLSKQFTIGGLMKNSHMLASGPLADSPVERAKPKLTKCPLERLKTNVRMMYRKCIEKQCMVTFDSKIRMDWS